MNAQSSRRKRLWELPSKCFCPLMGVCFEVTELKPILARSCVVPGKISDYELHVAAVRCCEKRTPFAEDIQKLLERRHTLQIQRFRSAKDREQLKAMWLDAIAAGQVASALWAAWTHPRCDELLVQEIYADIHMLQHQMASSERLDLQQFQQLQKEHAALVREMATIQERFTQFRETQLQDYAVQQKRLQEARAEIHGLRAQALPQTHKILPKDSVLHHRTESAETRARQLSRRVEDLEARLGHALEENTRLEHTLASLLQAQATPAEDAESIALQGQCVLCVGGRSGTVETYRNLVERLGGKFIHHDGGQEDSIHRLESSIASADAIICQAGCINHGAYWKVKDYCKKTGKSCFYARNPSISNFIAGLKALGQRPALPEHTDMDCACCNKSCSAT